MRLFWRLMSLVYPGLFNGSEKLNAIELTKRMAWGYRGVAESLGVQVNFKDEEAGTWGMCFRIIYGGGNTLEAVMKGELLE